MRARSGLTREQPQVDSASINSEYCKMAIDFKGSVRRAANAAGFEIYKNSGWRWSHQVDGYYPVNAIPRWGYGKPPHPQISDILDAKRPEFSELIKIFSQHADLLKSIPLTGDANGKTPFWKNDWFENLDAVALVGILASKKPKRYFEIGCGNSTKFARYVIETMRLPTKLLSIDPEPRASIDDLCDETIRRGLEDCDVSVFDQLDANDILFFDGSHRIFTNSDVTVFFLEVIPRLKPGVVVHIHDIFLPVDYPPEWSRKLYSEQYILAALLLCPKPQFKVLFPNWYVCNDAILKWQVTSLLEPIGCIAQGWSFWLETV
jgi:hypothetical protein